MIVLSESNKLIETPLPDESEMGVYKKQFVNTLTDITTINQIIPKQIDPDSLVSFEHKGLGSARVAYSISSGSQAGTIFKFARNDSGLAQNKAESIILSDSEVKSNPHIIKLLDYDKESAIFNATGNPLWLQLQPITPYLDDTAIDIMANIPKGQWDTVNKAKLDDWSSYFGSDLNMLYRLLNGIYNIKYFKLISLLEYVSNEHIDDEYIEQTLYYIGKMYSKSSIEDVFDIDTDNVDYNDKLKKYSNPFINGVYEIDKPLDKKDIKVYREKFEEFGIPDIQYTISKLKEVWNSKLSKRVGYLVSLGKIAVKYNLYFPDLASIHNWGKGEKGYPVIFDIGLDIDTYQKFYKKTSLNIS